MHYFLGMVISVTGNSHFSVRSFIVFLIMFWLVEVRYLSTFLIKRRVRKLPQSFLFVEIGSPNNCRATCVGCSDNYNSALS